VSIAVHVSTLSVSLFLVTGALLVTVFTDAFWWPQFMICFAMTVLLFSKPDVVALLGLALIGLTVSAILLILALSREPGVLRGIVEPPF